MDNLSRLGFLKYASIGRLFVVGNTLLVFPTRRTGLPAREIGSFTNHVKSYANQAAKIPTLCSESSTLSLASKFASRVSEIRFCLGELIECLTNRQSSAAESFSRPPRMDQLFANFTRNAAAFRSCAPSTIAESSIISELTKQIRPPCGIFSGTIVPIREVPFGETKEDHLCIADKSYVLELEEAKSLENVCQAIRLRVKSENTLTNPKRKSVTELAEAVIADATQLLGIYPSTACGFYRSIFKDSCHELQHNDSGDFVLVRGPVQHRLIEEKLFVGLPIRGKSLRQMLSVPPTIANEPGKLWTATGCPSENAICMGSPRQYAHLLSSPYIRAEAIVQWLDAGVIVATARPEYHKSWHRDSEDSRQVRRFAPVRGGRRHA